MLQYDNYLTKLQNICTENVGEEGKPVYETMKSAIQVFHNFHSRSASDFLLIFRICRFFPRRPEASARDIFPVFSD